MGGTSRQRDHRGADTWEETLRFTGSIGLRRRELASESQISSDAQRNPEFQTCKLGAGPDQTSCDLSATSRWGSSVGNRPASRATSPCKSLLLVRKCHLPVAADT